MQRMEEEEGDWGVRGWLAKRLEVIHKKGWHGKGRRERRIRSLRSGYITGDGEFYVAYYAGPLLWRKSRQCLL